MTKQTKQAAAFLTAGFLAGTGVLSWVIKSERKDPYLHVSLSHLGSDPAWFNQKLVAVEGVLFLHTPGEMTVITPEYQLTSYGLYLSRKKGPLKLGYYGHIAARTSRKGREPERMRIFIPGMVHLPRRNLRIRGQVIYSAEGAYVLNVHSLEGLQ